MVVWIRVWYVEASRPKQGSVRSAVRKRTRDDGKLVERPRSEFRSF